MCAYLTQFIRRSKGFPDGKESAQAISGRDQEMGFNLSGRSPGSRHGNPLYVFSLENPVRSLGMQPMGSQKSQS